MAFLGLEYGPIDSIFMLGTELLFRVKGRAVARTAFTGKFPPTGRGWESGLEGSHSRRGCKAKEKLTLGLGII